MQLASASEALRGKYSLETDPSGQLKRNIKLPCAFYREDRGIWPCFNPPDKTIKVEPRQYLTLKAALANWQRMLAHSPTATEVAAHDIRHATGPLDSSYSRPVAVALWVIERARRSLKPGAKRTVVINMRAASQGDCVRELLVALAELQLPDDLTILVIADDYVLGQEKMRPPLQSVRGVTVVWHGLDVNGACARALGASSFVCERQCHSRWWPHSCTCAGRSTPSTPTTRTRFS